MYQTINDEIAVIGYFEAGNFYPKKFQWQQRIYQVEQITFKALTKDGGVRWLFYSVVSGPNVYRLCHNLETQKWLLKEVWCEG